MAKKRKYGSGTVRKRSDGRWEARVVVGYDDNGNPKTKNVLAKTKAECLVKLEELKEKYAPPVTRCKPDMPFGDWMDFWYQNYCKPQLRLNTQLGYEDRIYKHIIPEIGKIPLNQLTQSDLQQFYAKLKTSGRLIRVEQYGPGLSDRMVRVCHANCRSALQKAVEEGLIRINPAIGCKLPPKKSGEMNILTQEEMQRFLIQRILAQIPGSEEQSDTSGNETPGTETNQVTYKIDADVLSYNGCEITVQSQKVKLFYFQSGSTQALLNCFKTKIAQNASEFRLLPNMDSVLRHRNYSEIFDLRNEEGINKFRGITGIELDKFALSKFLGKYRKVSGMIQSKEENEFEKDLMLILDERTLISNYGTWERLFEILILNNRYDLYKQLAIRIVDAIERYSVPEDMCNASVKTHDSLLRVFLSAMQRTTAIVWNADIDRVLDAVCEKVGKLRGNPKYTQALITMFDKETIYTTRTAYCETRMVNKYLLPLPIDCVINNLGKEEANLSVFADMLRMMDTTWLEEDSKRKRVYYPYMVLPQEISFALTCKDLLANTESIDPESQHKSVNSMFIRLNYPLADTEKRKIFSLKKIETGVMSQIASARNLYFTSVDSAPKSEKDKLTIAVGSVKLSVKDFTDVLDGRPNRGYERYEQFAKVFDEAINQKADMLVLPENFLPFEWIPSVARMCANNQLALITGIEHFVVPQQGCNGQVYNLTLVILPYECDDYRFAYVSYHNKVAYAPIEISEIRGRRYTYKEGNAYQLFGWHNVWFPVYCCFELASIQDRAIFQEYADMVVAVEWNKDVPYYSNIIESLSRDLHCYCVQVNSSDYGDSRIVAPKDSVSKDIIKTKGGQNSCILVDTIDIKSLRDFQMLEYSMQKKDGRFKPSPPGINPDGIIQSKRKNKLKP